MAHAMAHAIDAGKVLAWTLGVIGGTATLWDRWAPRVRRRLRLRRLRRGGLVEDPKLGELQEVCEQYGQDVLHPDIQRDLNQMQIMLERSRAARTG
jgi:hypothetical protein